MVRVDDKPGLRPPMWLESLNGAKSDDFLLFWIKSGLTGCPFIPFLRLLDLQTATAIAAAKIRKTPANADAEMTTMRNFLSSSDVKGDTRLSAIVSLVRSNLILQRLF